ncbi:MAG TPA: tetratricopeptide repeat protein, partial [Longimicrobiales bacterium]|nr:tetratricopeptide repeat protein [Longimicrobiales bacterium]
MAALAPDEPEEPVLDMAALAPDEPEEPVLDMAALAPDAGPEPGGQEAIDIGLLSPDEPKEVVIDLDALRGHASEVGQPQEDRDATTELPGEEPTPIPGVDVEAPRAEADEATGGADERAPDPGAEAGEEEVGEQEPAGEEEDAADDDESAEPVYTRTLAELYVKQGAVARALGVLRHLHAADPDDPELAERIAQLEDGADAPLDQPSAESSGDRRAWRPDQQAEEPDEEVEALARDLSQAGDDGHDVQTPFAWGEQEAEAPATEDQTIRDYFDGLLSWEPGEER